MNTTRQTFELNSEDQFGKRYASLLSDGSNGLPHEISERLKSSRMLALSKRSVIKAETASSVVGFSTTAALHAGGEKFSWWSRLAATIPLFALVAGLMAIQHVQDEFWADEIASVDAELLSDELPPSAYTDPGFVQYLHNGVRD